MAMDRTDLQFLSSDNQFTLLFLLDCKSSYNILPFSWISLLLEKYSKEEKGYFFVYLWTWDGFLIIQTFYTFSDTFEEIASCAGILKTASLSLQEHNMLCWITIYQTCYKTLYYHSFFIFWYHVDICKRLIPILKL